MRRVTKYSCGVICFRYDKRSDQVQALMIKKRNTFAFVDFVSGKYNLSKLHYLLDDMSNEEKIDIWSLDFSKMWFRVQLVDEEDNDKYIKARNIFYRNFGKDNGKSLRSLLSNSQSSESIWELPKGRCNSGEKPLNCAIREFYEETMILPGEYNILSDVSYRNTVRNATTNYISDYYLALASAKSKINNPHKLKLDYSDAKQISEIIGIRWMDINQIKAVDSGLRLYEFMKTMFKIVRSEFKIKKITKGNLN